MVMGRRTPRASAIRLRSAWLGTRFLCSSGALVDGDVLFVCSHFSIALRS